MDSGESDLDSSFPQTENPCLIVEDSQPDSVALEDDPESSYSALLARRLSNLQPTSHSPVLVRLYRWEHHVSSKTDWVLSLLIILVSSLCKRMATFCFFLQELISSPTKSHLQSGSQINKSDGTAHSGMYCIFPDKVLLSVCLLTKTAYLFYFSRQFSVQLGFSSNRAKSSFWSLLSS